MYCYDRKKGPARRLPVAETSRPSLSRVYLQSAKFYISHSVHLRFRNALHSVYILYSFSYFHSRVLLAYNRTKMATTRKVLIIGTGGTIASETTPGGLTPVSLSHPSHLSLPFPENSRLFYLVIFPFSRYHITQFLLLALLLLPSASPPFPSFTSSLAAFTHTAYPSKPSQAISAETKAVENRYILPSNPIPSSTIRSPFPLFLLKIGQCDPDILLPCTCC